MTAKYERSRLTERQWHKIVVHANDSRGLWQEEEAALKKRVVDAANQCTSDVMVRNGGSYCLLMVADDEDMVFLRMKLALTVEDMRGKGDWAGKKYTNAKNNRI